MGDDMGLGSVCFDFCATNVVHLSMSSMRQQPVIEPEPMSSSINYQLS